MCFLLEEGESKYWFRKLCRRINRLVSNGYNNKSYWINPKRNCGNCLRRRDWKRWLILIKDTKKSTWIWFWRWQWLWSSCFSRIIRSLLGNWGWWWRRTRYRSNFQANLENMSVWKMELLSLKLPPLSLLKQ